MKISENRDPRAMRIKKPRNQKDAAAKRIFNKERKQKDAAAFVAKKKMPLSTALFDSLDSYDQVLSCASKGTLHLCSVPELHSVLRVNGFQFFNHRKDYIEKNFSVLSGVLFQTRFSSLITGDMVITAVALEDSEVVQDLAALQWLNGASKDPVLLSPEEGTSLGGRQSDCMSNMTLDGLADDQLSAEDCYRPDMSMIVSVQARSSASMRSPDQRGDLCSQEEIVTNGLEGRLLTEQSLPLFCLEEQPPYLSPPLASHDNTRSESQEEHVTPSRHSFFANVDIPDAEAKLESEEEDMIQKFPPFICQTLESFSSKMCSLPFINGVVMKIPHQNHGTLALCAKKHIIFEPEAEQLAEPNYEEVSEVKEQSSFSSVSSPGLVEEPAQPSPPLFKSDHSAIASQEFCQAEVDSKSKEEFDLVEKFAMEALELNVVHGLFKEDDLSDIQLLDETSSERNIEIMANVQNFVELEEDQCSNSCHIQEVQLNSPVCVVSSPQETSSDFVGFLGLLAQVSTGHSNALDFSNCSLEAEHAMLNSEARSSAEGSSWKMKLKCL